MFKKNMFDMKGSKTYSSAKQMFNDLEKEANKWYNKYIIYPFRYNVLYQFKRVRMLVYKIKYRIKNKCPYEDTFALDYTFFKWIYPRLKCIIKWKLKHVLLEKKQIKDYKRMLILSERLKDKEFAMCDKRTYKQSEEFLELFKQYIHKLWN